MTDIPHLPSDFEKLIRAMKEDADKQYALYREVLKEKRELQKKYDALCRSINLSKDT